MPGPIHLPPQPCRLDTCDLSRGFAFCPRCGCSAYSENDGRHASGQPATLGCGTGQDGTVDLSNGRRSYWITGDTTWWVG